RNYALAVVFITGAALLLASGGQPVDAPGAYVLARGVDTAAGCAVALLVFRLLPGRPAALLPPLMVDTLRSAGRMVEHLARGEVGTAEARRALHDLRRHGFLLEDAHAAAVAGGAAQRALAEGQWPLVTGVLQLVYRALS